MFTPNRRKERNSEIYEYLAAKTQKQVNTKLLEQESRNEILEGTGSLVCDYSSKTAFAAISPRTSVAALETFNKLSGYTTVSFCAKGPDGKEIYHTNVMMTMADAYVLVGLDTIDEENRNQVKAELEALGKDVILLSNEQIFNHFCGNMLQLQNNSGQKFLVMSEEAKQHLSDDQIKKITMTHGNTILSCPIHLIEKIGGGSARCMMAEIFYS